MSVKQDSSRSISYKGRKSRYDSSFTGATGRKKSRMGWFGRKISRSSKTGSSEYDGGSQSDSDDTVVPPPVNRDMSFRRTTKQLRQKSRTGLKKVFSFGSETKSNSTTMPRKKAKSRQSSAVVEIDLDDITLHKPVPEAGNHIRNIPLDVDLDASHQFRSSLLLSTAAEDKLEKSKRKAERKASKFKHSTSEYFLDVDSSEDIDRVFGNDPHLRKVEPIETNLSRYPSDNFEEEKPRAKIFFQEMEVGTEGEMSSVPTNELDASVDLEATCAVSL